MKRVTLLSQVDLEICRGCKVCEKVCPVYAIAVQDKKAKVDTSLCRGCANCADRCPFYAIQMVKRETPFTVGVDVKSFDSKAVLELCAKAHFNPQQILCYCTNTRAEEVAAAILDGAKTPHELSLRTGIRTGCTIECIQPVLRMLEAAGIEPEKAKGWQWYGKTVTAWDLLEEVKEKYNERGFYFEEDKALLEQIAKTDVAEGGEQA